MIEATYQRACPSCGGDVERERLLRGLPCSKCSGTGGELKWAEELEEEYENFSEFFLKRFGLTPWGPQKTWAKMALSGLDVVISAPTGTGKSTFLAALSLYLKEKGKKVLYVVPSKSLEAQVKKRVNDEIEVITMRKLMMNTNQYRGYDIYLFDDVDSALKSIKSVESVMKVMNLDEAIPVVQKMMYLIKTGKLGNEEGSREYAELKERLDELKRRKSSQAIFASATTGEAKFMVKLMLSVLGLSPARFPPIIRYVDDVKVKSEDVVKGTVETVKQFVSKGLRGIVFVHEGFPIEEVTKTLEAEGIRAKVVKSGRIKPIKELEEGKLDVLVAYATRYGVLARGIDLPDVIKFAVFLRPPFKKYDLRKGLSKPFVLIRMLRKLGKTEKALKLASAISKLSEAELALLQKALEGEAEVEGYLLEVKKLIEEMRDDVLGELKDKVIVDRGNVIKNGKVYLVDARTYLQASGRTSRLTPHGMTHGVSVVVYDDDDLMKALEEELKDVTEFKEKLVLPKGKKKIKAKTALMIVESPTKAKTFSKIMRGGGKMEIDSTSVYLGAYSNGDEVLFMYIAATKGHLFDITLDDLGTYGIEVGDRIRVYYAPINRCPQCRLSWASSNQRCPKCGAPGKSSLETVKALRKLAFMVDEVYIATDPDEEGEKIAWDVLAMIKPFNSNIKRLRYYEVTLTGLRKAFESIGNVDEGLVMSQIVRRIDDRLVGFEISSKLKSRFGELNHGLGRVQGPVLKHVVERMEEWKRNAGYTVRLKLSNGDAISIFVKDKEEAKKIISMKKVKVVRYEEEVVSLKPLPPYTTDVLLQDASRVGIHPQKAMRLAQDLFEMGFITYHRTDSTRVSDAGLAVAKEWITEKFGEGEFVPRRWGEGGAHEAIRPTRPLSAEELSIEFTLLKLDFKAKILYDMIFRRFMASQMKEAKVKRVRIEYEVYGRKIISERYVEVLEPGWTAVWKLKVHKVENVSEAEVVETSLRRSSLSSLPKIHEIIKWMKDVRIGRPSTYAQTIENLRRHGYIVITPRNYMIATKKGKSVEEYVAEIMPELLSASYTRRLEEIMDMAKVDLASALRGVLNTFRGIASAGT